jgi:hypothetical protein
LQLDLGDLSAGLGNGSNGLAVLAVKAGSRAFDLVELGQVTSFCR